jgi:hypothetical protein
MIILCSIMFLSIISKVAEEGAGPAPDRWRVLLNNNFNFIYKEHRQLTRPPRVIPALYGYRTGTTRPSLDGLLVYRATAGRNVIITNTGFGFLAFPGLAKNRLTPKIVVVRRTRGSFQDTVVILFSEYIFIQSWKPRYR